MTCHTLSLWPRTARAAGSEIQTGASGGGPIHSPSLRIAALGLSALLLLTASHAIARPPLCTGAGPEAFLACFAKAYAGRDPAAFSALLASADRCRSIRDTKQPDFDHQAAMTGAVRVFRAPDIRKVEIEFGKPAAVEAGEAPGTWILRDVPSIARYEGTADEGGPGRSPSRR